MSENTDFRSSETRFSDSESEEYLPFPTKPSHLSGIVISVFGESKIKNDGILDT